MWASVRKTWSCSGVDGAPVTAWNASSYMRKLWDDTDEKDLMFTDSPDVY